MKLPREGHGHFHQLISARLDGFLEASEEQELSEHLAECPTCRATVRDYRTQRSLMASLQAKPAPRDLWARTAAALDREMARTPRASERARLRDGGPIGTRSAPGSRWLGLTAVTSVLLAGAVVATQLQSTVAPTSGASSANAQPTPFDVAPQDMSVFDFTAHGVSVYQMGVSEACPPLSIDCTSVDLPTSPVIQISGNSSSNRSVAVNSRSGQLALVTSVDSGAETVSVVRLPPYRNASATGAPTQVPGAIGTDQALATPGATGPTGSGAAATDQATQAGAATPTPIPTPARTPTPTSDGSATPRPTPSPPDTAPPITPDPKTPKPVKTHRPTPLPTDPAPTTEPSAPPTTAPTEAVASTLPSDPGSSPVTPADTTTAQPAEVAMAIATGVHLVGAAPAWSNAGDMLAFSATPADLSTGPDIYLYKVGQAKAVRLTQDHRSYFASWAADRIVISRAPADDLSGAVTVSTVVRDLVTGEERQVASANLWLPAVDPSGHYAVAWVGRLHTDGQNITPRFGGLYYVDWTSIDPFADGAAPPAGSVSTAATADTATPGATPVDAGATPDPTRTPRNHRPSPSADPAITAPPTAPPTAAQTAPPDPTATDPTIAAIATPFQAVDPQRDETANPVLDWVVNWSADSKTVGIWVADTPGSNWGRLAVVRDSLQNGQFSLLPVLGPTLARRGFSLGVDRVAWVTPSQDATSSEMRIRTWDANGYGDIRIHNVDAGDSLPSF